MDHDLYGVLGVPSSASEAEIRHAFRELAKKYHPDVSQDKQHAARRFIEVHEAAETLLDSRRRAEYDFSRARAAAGQAAPRPAPPGPAPPAPPGTSPPAAPRRPAPAPARPAAPAPASRATARHGAFPDTLKAIVFMLAAVAFLGALLSHNPSQPAETGVSPHDYGTVPGNGTVLWKAAGYQLANGWGTNLAAQGTQFQVYPGTSADLAVYDGSLTSGGHIAFLPQGTPPTYQNCRFATLPVSTQSEDLSMIKPGVHGDLCSSGSSGGIAYLHVTRDNGSALTMSITIWQDI